MNWNIYGETLKKSGFCDSKAKVIVDIFNEAGKVIDLSNDAVRKWQSGENYCQACRYFPEGKINQERVYKYFRSRSDDIIHKLQENFRNCDDVGCIKTTTNDMDIFCKSLVNQFLDLLRLPFAYEYPSEAANNDNTQNKQIIDNQNNNEKSADTKYNGIHETKAKSGKKDFPEDTECKPEADLQLFNYSDFYLYGVEKIFQTDPKELKGYHFEDAQALAGKIKSSAFDNNEITEKITAFADTIIDYINYLMKHSVDHERYKDSDTLIPSMSNYVLSDKLDDDFSYNASAYRNKLKELYEAIDNLISTEKSNKAAEYRAKAKGSTKKSSDKIITF